MKIVNCHEDTYRPFMYYTLIESKGCGCYMNYHIIYAQTNDDGMDQYCKWLNSNGCAVIRSDFKIVVQDEHESLWEHQHYYIVGSEAAIVFTGDGYKEN